MVGNIRERNKGRKSQRNRRKPSQWLWELLKQPEKNAQRDLGEKEWACYYCGKEGHLKWDCPQASKPPPAPCLVCKGPHWRRDWPQRRRFRGSDSQDNQDWRCLRVPTQAPILITPKEPRVLITVGGQSIPLLMSMSEAFSISFILEYNFITQKLWAIRPHPWPQIEFSSGGQESQGLLWFSSNLSKGSLLFEMISSRQSNWYGLI